MYQIKVYDLDKVYKNTINPGIIKSDISFNKQINGGLGQLNIVLDLAFNNTDYIQGDIVEVYNFNGGSSNLIYVGYIDQIEKTITNYEQTTLICYGLASLLKRIVYNVSTDYTATLSDDPYDVVDDVVTYFNTKYNYLTLSGSTTGTTISYDLSYDDCYNVIKEMNDLSDGYYWYLENYTLNFKPNPVSATHTFTLQKDLVELNVDEDSTDLVNTLILTYKTSTATYTDATSISTYGLREKYISNTQIGDVTSADEFGSKYIADNKDPKQKMTLTINNEADINNINPGDTCKIRNINKTGFDNLLISKVNYNQYEIQLELVSYDNFIQLLP